MAKTGAPIRQVSRAAIVLIKRFEGFRAEAARLNEGGWTIGYGHTRTARQGARVSEADAEALLAYDLIAVVHAINEWVHAPLNQNQFDALASFVFNIGLENFRRSTTLRRLNEGRMLEAAAVMELWRRADFEGERIVLDALVRRRSVEKTLFLKPDAWPVAPSPVLPPRIDYEAAALLPSQTPTALKSSLAGERVSVERDLASEDGPPAFHEPAGPQPAAGADRTAAEAAAETVSRRLQSLFADEAETDGAAAPEEFVESSTETGPSAAPPAADLSDTVAAQPRLVAPEPAAPPAPVVQWGRPRRRRRVLGPLSLFGLGLLGVALFVSAIAFGFQTPWVTDLGGPVSGGTVGWGLGLLGAALFALAVYGLLSRTDSRSLRRDD